MAPHSQYRSCGPSTTSTPAIDPGSSRPGTSQSTATIKGRRGSAKKRRRSSVMLLSPTSENGNGAFDDLKRQQDGEHSHTGCDGIAIESTGEGAGKAITPFLAKHIPTTYNPMGAPATKTADAEELAMRNNTKFCNRHRPDRRCRRQADGPSMEHLQNKLSSLSQNDRTAISHVWSVFSAAPGKQRELILQGILGVACFNQLSFISAQVRDMIKIDFISLLPTEIALQILTKLDTISLCKAARVSRRWRELADDDTVWMTICQQHIGSRCRGCGWGLPLMEQKRLRQERRQKQLAGQKRQREDAEDEAGPTKRRSSPHREVVQPAVTTESALSSSGRRTMPWKDVYRARFKVGSNWRRGRYTLDVLKGAHDNGVTCLQLGSNALGSNMLASGSYDCSVHMWDLSKREVVKTYRGHTEGVRCLWFDRGQLVSGSLDGTVKFWNIQTGINMKTLKARDHGVAGAQVGFLSVHSDGTYLAAGCMDNNVYVWDTKTRRSLLLQGHKDFVNCVRVDAASRTVFSASDDCKVILWDLDNGRPIQVFISHVGQVQQVIPLPSSFEMDVADLEKLRREDDTDTDLDLEYDEPNPAPPLPGQQVPRRQRQTRTPPLPLVNTPFFPDDPDRPNPSAQFMLTAGLDNTIRLWHVASAKCLNTFFGHLEGIWGLAADNLRCVSCGEDGMAKIWRIQDGVCEKTFTGHQGPVMSLALNGEMLVTGGDEGEVRVMDFGGDGEELD